MHARSIVCLTLTALAAAACGDAPRPVETGGPRPPAAAPAGHSADDGHDHSAHAAGAGQSPSWSGSIVLSGERAESESAVIFVSLRSTASPQPFWSTKFPVSAGVLGDDGTRRVPFSLSSKTNMMPMGALPAELQGTPLMLSVRYDSDGDGLIDTKSEGDASVAQPVGWGGEGIEIAVGG